MIIIAYYSILDVLESNEHDSSKHFDVTEDMLQIAIKSCPDKNDNELKSLLGREWFGNLKRLQFIISFILHYGSSGLLYISQTNPFLLEMYKSNSGVRDQIQRLIKIGALFDLNTPYSYTARWNKAKCYYANKHNLEQLRRIYKAECKKQGIQPDAEVFHWNASKKKKKIASASDGEILPLTYSGAFCSNFKISTSSHTEEQINEAVLECHPQIPYYTEKIMELNAGAEEDELIRFDWNIRTTRSGSYYRKLGMRATTPLCCKISYKKQEKIAEEQGQTYSRLPGIEYREDYLDRVLGENWEEYDMNASILRIQCAMHRPEIGMGNLQEDLYHTVFNPYMDDLKYLFPSIRTWGDARKLVKKLYMRIINSSSAEECVSKLIRKERELRKMDKNAILEIDLTKLSKDQTAELVKVFQRLRDAVLQYCGDYGKHSTEVYFDESCIYIEARLLLAERGIRVCQVYDGFFFRQGEKPADIEAIFHDAYRRYCERVAICKEEQKHAEQENIELLDNKIS